VGAHCERRGALARLIRNATHCDNKCTHAHAGRSMRYTHTDATLSSTGFRFHAARTLFHPPAVNYSAQHRTRHIVRITQHASHSTAQSKCRSLVHITDRSLPPHFLLNLPPTVLNCSHGIVLTLLTTCQQCLWVGGEVVIKKK
jgi:hypothetical protein